MNAIEELRAFEWMIKRGGKTLGDSLVGRKVRILSNYNAQPFGTSKKSKKGTIQTIREVYISNRITLFIEGHDLGLSLDEVELV